MVPDTRHAQTPNPRLTRRGFGAALLLAALGVAGAGAGAELYMKRGGHTKIFRPIRLMPSQVLDLSVWKVGLPTAKEVAQPALADYSGTAFEVVTAVQFTAYCGDKPQDGSKYARSELREMHPDGSPASWSTTSGTHELALTQRITHLPIKKPQLICGQIHSTTDYLIMVELDGHRLYVRNRDETVGVLDPDYQLGTMFDLTLTATTGNVTVAYNGVEKVHVPLAESGCYFKVGCYLQSNTATGDLPSAYGQVEISHLEITHF